MRFESELKLSVTVNEPGVVQIANDELEEITPQLRAHPDVLELLWQIYAAAKKWEPCVDIAAAITKLAPDRPSGWIHRAYALHELKRTAEARDALLPVVTRFLDDATACYTFACYAAQLGDLPTAHVWLKQALAVNAAKKPFGSRLRAALVHQRTFVRRAQARLGQRWRI